MWTHLLGALLFIYLMARIGSFPSSSSFPTSTPPDSVSRLWAARGVCQAPRWDLQTFAPKCAPPPMCPAPPSLSADKGGGQYLNVAK